MDLARVVAELIKDEGQRLRLGEAGHRFVAEERSWARVTRELDRIYRELAPR